MKPSLELLENLHTEFNTACYTDGKIAAILRMSIEGKIFACRELLNDFESEFMGITRGFRKLDDVHSFMLGYHEFRTQYAPSTQ